MIIINNNIEYNKFIKFLENREDIYVLYKNTFYKIKKYDFFPVDYKVMLLDLDRNNDFNDEKWYTDDIYSFFKNGVLNILVNDENYTKY